MELDMTNLSVKNTKRRQAKKKLEQLYEDKFHKKWFADPSARATRNQYRQLLTEPGEITAGNNTGASEPLMNRLIRGDYYSEHLVSRTNSVAKRNKAKPVNLVAKNIVLQGLQGKLNTTQKVKMHKLYSMADAQHRRVGGSPQRSIRRLGGSGVVTNTTLSLDGSTPMPGTLGSTPFNMTNAEKDTQYWQVLDGLNKKKTVNFFTNENECAPYGGVALAMTDPEHASVPRSQAPVGSAVRAAARGRQQGRAGAVQTPPQPVRGHPPPAAADDMGLDLGDIGMDLGEEAATAAAVPARRERPERAQPQPRATAVAYTPPGSPSAGGGGGAFARQDVRALAAKKRKPVKVVRPGSATPSPTKQPRFAAHTPSAAKYAVSGSPQREWDPSLTRASAAAPNGTVQHHHVSVRDHTEKRVGSWKNPYNMADQRVPIVSYDLPVNV